MNEYDVKILKVVDGDTVDVDIDLGFGVTLRDERVRIMGIDTPESRTSDKVEKVFGLASKERLKSLLSENAILITFDDKKGEDMKGKFGRILGDFKTEHGQLVSEILVEEGYAVKYFGQNKELVEDEHLKNREKLISEGKVEL
jgi:micrococcal nuclease